MMKHRIGNLLAAALLAVVLTGLCACSVSPETQGGTTPDTEGTSEQEATTGDDESIEITPVTIPQANLITPADLQTQIETESWAVYDTRTYLEYAKGSIPGALNIPFRFVEDRQAEIPRNMTVVFLAEDDSELSSLYGLLLDLGFDSENIRMLEGGIGAWQTAGFEVEEYEIEACSAC
jgi:rhodanese-related sulfurtransferase